MIYATQITNAGIPPADAIAETFLKAVQATRQVPKEVHVLREDFAQSLLPILRSFGVAVRVQRKLPAFDEAAAAMSAYL